MSAHWTCAPASAPDDTAARAARDHQARLTKPPGALGRLETLAIRLAAWQGTPMPELARVHICVFAADHGVAARGVSAFPQAVTGQMVRNFSAGGAAICVLARALAATLEVVDLGTVTDPGPLPGVINARIAPGTADFCTGPAMDAAQLDTALGAGRTAVQRALAAGARLFIGGEMGIGNTAAAAALACALLGAPPVELCGPGTGLDVAGVQRKAATVQAALHRHRDELTDPAQALRRLGGFEIAALTGACIAAAQAGLPVLVDGFIATTAALAAVRINPGVADWLIFAHRSAEPGHARVLAALDADPLLDLGMYLGEGSGAAVAVPLLRLACALHAGMATFAQAGVAGAPGAAPATSRQP